MRRKLILAGVVVTLLALLPLLMLACSPGSSTALPVGTTTAQTPANGANSVTVNLIAQNLAFNLKTISVPAGAQVTVILNNMDSGIQHNFSLYQQVPGGQAKAVFIGDPGSGPKTLTYHFNAPTDSKATYFFYCDFHPQTMSGSFVVTP